MSTSLFIGSLIFGLAIIVLVLFLLSKERISIKYSIVWILLFCILILALIIPNLMSKLTHLLGFMSPSNMVLTVIIGLLILINIALTVIVSEHDKKIRLLIQEVSMLKDSNK